jgi:predicted TIM-barrel fold metal-dependent hydrolase
VEGQLASGNFRTGARVLARLGLCLENTLYFPQLPELAAFAKAIPDLTIISNHIGGLMRVGPYANRDTEVLATWRRGIAAVAECPNVVMKLGGIGMPRTGFDWHTRQKPIGLEALAEAMAPWMTYCIEQFGPTRCMFESNFPVDKVSYSYNVLYNRVNLDLWYAVPPTKGGHSYGNVTVRRSPDPSDRGTRFDQSHPR